MARYRVYLMPVVRVTVEGIEAAGPKAARDAAFKAVNFYSLFDEDDPVAQPDADRVTISSVGWNELDDGAIVDLDEPGGESWDFDGLYAGHADLVRACQAALDMPDGPATAGWNEVHNALKAALAKTNGDDSACKPPRVLIIVRGGVADYSADPGVKVCLVDYDNLESEMDESESRRGEANVLADAIPEEFADLA